jgi:polysaccharide biosynthesis protein PslA
MATLAKPQAGNRFETDAREDLDPVELFHKPVKRSQRRQVRAALVAGDLFAIASGFALAAWLRGDGAQILEMLLASIPLYLLMAVQYRAYSFRTLTELGATIRRPLLALGFAALVGMGIGFAFKVSSDFSRVAVLAGIALAAGAIVVARFTINRIARRMAPNGFIEEFVLCDGTMLLPKGGERVLNATALGLQPRLDSPQMLDRIGRALQGADRIVIACGPEQRQAWTAALKGLGIAIEVMIPEVEALGVLETRNYDGRLTAVVGRGALCARDQFLKRAFDLTVLIAILPMLLVVTAVVAILIKLDDGGPIFFVQKRIGQGNRLFSMYKFRSMRVAQLDSDGKVSASRNDSRVTKIGKILRSTSVDELPQLFNVLMGDMSVVGPRPHALASTAEDALFWDVDHRYWWRHAAKPGLTGLAQVRGFRGATETMDDLRHRVQSDLEYLNGWSLWRDLRITIATLKVVLHAKAF